MFDVTLPKVVVSWLPRPCIAAIAATAISAAIRPYSIAVAPFLLAKILRMVVIPVLPCSPHDRIVSVVQRRGSGNGAAVSQALQYEIKRPLSIEKRCRSARPTVGKGFIQ